MNRMRYILIALMWGFGISANVYAQDEHEGHDHEV